MASRISASVICSTSCGIFTAPIPFSLWISLRPDLGCGGGTERKFYEACGLSPHRSPPSSFLDAALERCTLACCLREFVGFPDVARILKEVSPAPFLLLFDLPEVHFPNGLEVESRLLRCHHPFFAAYLRSFDQTKVTALAA